MVEIPLYQKDEDKLLIKQVVQAVLASDNSDTINNFVGELIDDVTLEENEDRCEAFCDRYDLGEWFNEAMLINEIDIIEELNGIFIRKREDEREAAEERWALEEIRQGNGS